MFSAIHSLTYTHNMGTLLDIMRVYTRSLCKNTTHNIPSRQHHKTSPPLIPHLMFHPQCLLPLSAHHILAHHILAHHILAHHIRPSLPSFTTPCTQHSTPLHHHATVDVIHLASDVGSSRVQCQKASQPCNLLWGAQPTYVCVVMMCVL